MKENKSRALEWLKRESIHLPEAPRGPYGVSLKVLRAAWERPVERIQLLELDEDSGRELAGRYYWYATGCDDLPGGVDYSALCMAAACDDSFLVRRWISDLLEVGTTHEVQQRLREANRTAQKRLVHGLSVRLRERLKYSSLWPTHYQRWGAFTVRVERKAGALM